MAEKPGSDNPTIVALDWVPERTLFVISRRFGAFAVAGQDLAGTLTSDDLINASRAYSRARHFDRVSVTPIRPTPGRPVAQAPADSPPGWFAEVSQTLDSWDEHVRKGIRARIIKSQPRQDRAGRELLPRYLRNDLTMQDAPPLTLRVSAGSGPWGATLLIKAGPNRVGRFLLSTGVLLLSNELQRQSVARFLEQSGHRVQQPILGWDQPPRLLAEVEPSSGWGAFRIVLGTGDDAYMTKLRPLAAPYLPVETQLRPLAALYFPLEGQLINSVGVWEPYIRELLAWQGLPVLKMLEFEPPDGYDPMLFDRLSWDLRGQMRVQKFVANARQAAEEASTSALRPSCRRLVAKQVADAVAEIIALSPRPNDDGTGHRARDHRTGILTPTQAKLLTSVVPPVDLPDAAFQAAQEAAEISRVHAPLLAALRLRAAAPDWWQQIMPWSVPLRDPRPLWTAEGLMHAEGAPREPIHSPGQMTEAEVESCPYPDLVRILQGPRMPWPDVPRDLTLADMLCMFVTAASLLHAGLVRATSSARKSSKCAICGCEFAVDTWTLPLLTFTQSGRYCPTCAMEAEKGSPSPWTPLRAAASLTAVQELTVLAGGPPSRVALAAPLRVLDSAGRTRQLLLRQVLPSTEGLQRLHPAWGTLLKDAGVLGTGWRPSYGTYTVAEDGHPCRSLLERYIDDFLSSQRIPHEIEPAYPYDEDLNRNGYRADWLIQGVLVEAVGMMGFTDYRRKIEVKQALADKCGVELLLVEEQDLAQLERVFHRWLASDS